MRPFLFTYYQRFQQVHLPFYYYYHSSFYKGRRYYISRITIVGGRSPSLVFCLQSAMGGLSILAFHKIRRIRPSRSALLRASMNKIRQHRLTLPVSLTAGNYETCQNEKAVLRNAIKLSAYTGDLLPYRSLQFGCHVRWI